MSDWLYSEVLPDVKKFMQEHFEHHVVYGEDHHFMSLELPQNFEWMQVGTYCLDYSPRYFVEILKYVSFRVMGVNF